MFRILFDAASLRVQDAEIEFGRGIALLGGLAESVNRLT
jgi:hypothetical protein